MRLIESYEDQKTVQIEGRTYPSECLVEDEDGIRILVVSNLDEIPIQVWARAHSSGARMLTCPDPMADGWLAISVEQYIEERTEHHPTHSFRLSLGSTIAFEVIPEYRSLFAGGSRIPPSSPPARSLSELSTNSGFVHLHMHSEFSPLDGLSTVKEMVERVVADGQGALAVTDHGVCAAHPHLQKEAKKAGVKPIFGIEANFTDNRFIRGTRRSPPVRWGPPSRCSGTTAISSSGPPTTSVSTTSGQPAPRRTCEGFYGRPRMDWDTLRRHNDGVMVSTACLRGPLAQKILVDDEEGARGELGRLLDIFGDRVWVELHTNQLEEQKRVNRRLVDLASEYGLPTIAVVDSHYPCYEDRQTHRVWIASQTNKALQDEADLFAGETDYHIMTEQEVRDSLAYLGPQVVDEAVGNTLVVAEQCHASVTGEVKAPVFSKAETEAQAIRRDVERLVDICMENWHRCVGKTHPVEVYEARFEREMRLLINKNFCGYFLMVSDYCRWARSHGILVGPGRGSGSGSLVSYLCDITGIDPVECDLMFERFLTEGRTALPDFDVDFPTSKRGMLTDYIIEKYGQENVVRVGSSIRLKNKGVVRDLARTLKGTIDIHYPDIDAASKIIEAAEGDKAGLGMDWEDLWDEFGDTVVDPKSEITLDKLREKYPDLFAYADKMVGRLKTYGKHAAGVVISPGANLTSSFPMRLAKTGSDDDDEGELVIEFDMDIAEELGLVKFDLLTLRNLDTIQATIDLITEDSIDVYSWRDEYEDQMVWDEISAGHTLGIFQIETPGGTRDTKRFKPKSLNELADVITLVRPGPKRSGLTEMYFRRKMGEEEVSVLDPRLEPVLASTYGCMIFQEQVIKTCVVLAGYTEEEADNVRRLLGKKKVEQVEEAGRKFLSRCAENDVDEKVANTIWDQMAEFAKYCVSGDTEVWLAASGPHSGGSITAEVLYQRIKLPAAAD